MIKLIFIGLYYFIAIYGSYKMGTDFFVDHNKELVYFFIIFIILLIVFILFTIFYSKNNYDCSFLYYFRLLTYLSFIFTYLIMWGLSFINNEMEFREVVTFKYQSVFSSIVLIIMTNAICSFIPILISSILYSILSKHYSDKELEAEIEYNKKISLDKRAIEKTNSEIDYYKKISEIKHLLESKVITQEKYNELENNLRKQYNIHE